MYHPPDLGTNDNTQDEYVELLNPTTAAITLQDTNGAWRIDGGVSYTFPLNTTIPAGGIILAVNFDPLDGAALNRFRTTYGLTNSAAAIFGPYAGKLGNRSDRVALEKPQYPDLPGDPYSWVILDEVIYGNQDPWPPTANGAGYALQRSTPTANGNTPASWFAAAPTPGTSGQPTLDQDSDGMPDAWENLYGLDPLNPADAAADADGDGMTNLGEFLSGTNPTDASNVLKFIAINLRTNSCAFRFTAIQGHSYSVQYRTQAPSGNWQKLRDVPAGLSTADVELQDDVSTGESRFYRIVTPAIP
jgi:hypothetical protein